MKLDALFIGAHPDDIELTCSGTLVKLVNSGKNAGIADLTRGELSTRGTMEIREKETNEATKTLGIIYRTNLNIRDGSIDNTEENRLKVIQIIRACSPELVFLPYPYDRHPDHVHASELIRNAAFYLGLKKIETEFEGKEQLPHRPSKLIYYMHAYTFEPSFIVDITNELESKMKSILCYKSQFHNPGSSESETFISDEKFLEFIKAKAQFYGFQIGAKYGEPFFTNEKIKLDPLNLFK
jgi:bacillithiol biosynthesis deacetylase BshB1